MYPYTFKINNMMNNSMTLNSLSVGFHNFEKTSLKRLVDILVLKFYDKYLLGQ